MECKRASKYEKGKIYKICSDDPAITEVYIGSCIVSLHRREYIHKYRYENNISTYASRGMFAQYGVDKFHIELLECFPCTSNKELCTREQHYIDTTINCVNEKRAFITEVERKNQDKLLHSKNYLLNKEDRNAKGKIYYETHKEQHNANIKIWGKKISTCLCGCVMTNHSLCHHRKTKKHADLMATLALSQALVQALPPEHQETCLRETVKANVLNHPLPSVF